MFELSEQFYKILSFTLIFLIVVNYLYKLFVRYSCEKHKKNVFKPKNEIKTPEFDKNDTLALHIVVRSELKMGKGKIAAQVGHAISGTIDYLQNHKNLWRCWKSQGEPKVVLKASNSEIEDMLIRARNSKVHIHKVYDAGRTQVKSGSNTVIAVGPAPKNILTMITGPLKLL